MPRWNQFITKYALDPEDLPVPHGVNVVVIESLDSEQYTDKKNVPQVRHRLWLAGWSVPLRLNNTRIKILQGMFGPNTEDCIGKKIALTVAAANNYGEVEAVINIHPFVPDQAATPIAVPPHLATTNMVRLQAAKLYGVPLAPPQGQPDQAAGQIQHGQAPRAHYPQQSGTGSTSPFHGGGGGGAGGGPGSFMASPATSVTAGGKAIGAEAASELILMLRERGRTWDWLAAHMRQHGMGSLVAGELPCDADQALRGPAWAIIKDLPKTVYIPDRPNAKARLIESWLGPPVTPTSSAALTPGEAETTSPPPPQSNSVPGWNPQGEPGPTVGGGKAPTNPAPQIDPNDIPF